LEVQQAPIHFCELLADLAAESLDLLVERAKALGNRLDVGLEILGDNAEVATGLSGRRIHSLEKLRVQKIHVAPCFGIAVADLLAKLGSHGAHPLAKIGTHLLSGVADLLAQIGAHLLGGVADLLAELAARCGHLLPEVAAKPIEI
jgi:hypothetical protein